MKTRIEISHEYDPVFVDVGRRIAKGEPPLWLLIGLNHFSGSIGTDASGERKQFGNVVEQMNDAAGVLLKWLPIYQHAGYGFQCPDDVTVVLEALPRIKRDLDLLGDEGLDRPPNVRREVCAAVVVEAWRLLHGKAELRSEKLYEVCGEYWRACGGDPKGETDDLENWRRPVKDGGNHIWVRAILVAVQNSM
jgi:hypothetical protein